MAYLALYRRFRPQSFDTLIGQEIVVKALVNQIKTDKIGHAYLFCGARGTGKTTVAKIFARAINCEEKTGTPCGKCSACIGLNDANSIDIIEMDAASNNKVEHVREIREKIQYPPVNGRFKVYIIDEVHMLTTEAFNALLKTLEEPPSHAVFILATTEPHRIPATILSRCMRFDFKLIPTMEIAKLIGDIYKEVGKEYEEEAIIQIARQGEGSVRDALSIADICLSFKNEKLTYKDVVEVLGASDSQKTGELIKSIFNGDSANALAVVDYLASQGKNVTIMIKDTLSLLRDIMVVKSCKNPEDILALPTDILDELKAISQLTDNNGLLRSLEIFSAVENDVKYSTHPRIIFETAVVKASQKQTDYNIDALLSRISKLEQMVNGDGVKVVEKIVEKPVEKIVEKVIEKPAKKEERTVVDYDSQDIPPSDLYSAFDNFEKKSSATESLAKLDIKDEVKEIRKVEVSQKQEEGSKAQLEQKTASNPAQDKRIWGMLIRKLRSTGNAMLWAICQELDGRVENGKINIYCQSQMEYLSLTKKDNYDKLNEVAKTICDYPVCILQSGKKEEIDNIEADIDNLKKQFARLDIEE